MSIYEEDDDNNNNSTTQRSRMNTKFNVTNNNNNNHDGDDMINNNQTIRKTSNAIPMYYTLATIFTTLQTLHYIICICVWLFLSNHVTILALVTLFHTIISGAINAMLVTQQHPELSRQQRMALQGGHTLMLTYFSGFGATSEYFRLAFSKPGASLKSLTSILERQMYSTQFLKLIFSWLIYSQLNNTLLNLSMDSTLGNSNKLAQLSMLIKFTWYSFMLTVGLLISTRFCLNRHRPAIVINKK